MSWKRSNPRNTRRLALDVRRPDRRCNESRPAQVIIPTVTVTPPQVLVRLMPLAMALAVGASPMLPIHAQQIQPAEQDQSVFRAGTSVVPVDVRVLDRAGNPVTDLRRDEFLVFENGAPQRIAYFSAQTFTPEAAVADAALRIRTHQTEALTPQNRRVFLIVLGRGRLQPPAKGVDGMLHFVRERLMPQDLVAVLAWDRATEFTTDHEKIAQLLDRFKKSHEGIEAKLKNALSGLAAVYGSKGIPSGLRSDIDAVFGGEAGSRGIRSIQSAASPNADRLGDDTRRTVDDLMDAANAESRSPNSTGLANATLEQFVEANARTMQDLNKLYLAVEYLRHVEGEKHLVFVSEAGLILPRAEDDKDIAAAASDARVSIDYVHTGGVPASALPSQYSASRGSVVGPATMAAGRPQGRMTPPPQSELWVFSTARSLATLTGGRFFANEFPNAAMDMDRIDAATRSEYLLGYTPLNTRLDGRYRNIAVRVTRPGLTVLYRHGYYANPDIAPFSRQRVMTYSRIAGAANYDKSVPDIPLKVSAKSTAPTPGAPLDLEITIDPRPLAFVKENGLNTDSVELAAFCVDDHDRLVGESWKTIELKYKDERLPVVMGQGITINIPLTLERPGKEIKVIVYDYRADLVGSVLVKVK
jgi:VWFA-related protein